MFRWILNLMNTKKIRHLQLLASMIWHVCLQRSCASSVAPMHKQMSMLRYCSFSGKRRFRSSPGTWTLCHIDTSPDAPASGVRPHVVHYEGGPLVAGVVNGTTIQTTPEEVPDLKQFVGLDIVCSDGSTLLGADDKAGVATIVALIARLAKDPSLKHPRLAIAFVPDEEIGHGASLLDLDSFGAPWAYTVDGEALGEFNYECFSAASAQITAHGTMVHPAAQRILW